MGIPDRILIVSDRETVLLCKPVNGFAVIFLTGPGDGLGPLGMVERIRIILGLQCNTAALTIVNTVLAGFVQEIAGVELNTGAIGVNRHGPAGNGVGQGGAGIAENFPVVIIAALQLQGFIICLNILPHSLGAAEIHRRALHIPKLPGGNILSIIGIEEPAGNGQQLRSSGTGFLVTCQIEIAVVGHVENGVLIADRIINDMQTAGCIQPVGYMDDGITGETLVTVGAAQPEGDEICFLRHGFPQPQMEEVGAAVQIVVAFVGGQAALGLRKSIGVPSTFRSSPVGIFSASSGLKNRPGMVSSCAVAAPVFS